VQISMKNGSKGQRPSAAVTEPANITCYEKMMTRREYSVVSRDLDDPNRIRSYAHHCILQSGETWLMVRGLISFT